MPAGCPSLTEIEGQRLDATSTVAVIDCRIPSSDEESYTWPMAAYAVIRVTPTTGEVVELGTWEQGHESGTYHELTGILRGPNGVATKLLLLERRGGLDQTPSNTLTVYELQRQTFAATVIVAENIDVEVAPNERTAKVTTCDSRLTSHDLEHPIECKDEPNPKLVTVELR